MERNLIDTKEWTSHMFKNIRNPKNQEYITIRANITKSKKISIRISIGLIICNLLEFTEQARVNIFLHKKDKNILLIKKCNKDEDGYKLNYSQKSNFMTFDFISHFYTEFKIKQTIVVDYDINSQKMLLVDLTKIRWEK